MCRTALGLLHVGILVLPKLFGYVNSQLVLAGTVLMMTPACSVGAGRNMCNFAYSHTAVGAAKRLEKVVGEIAAW
jgi:hypothetical protein